MSWTFFRNALTPEFCVGCREEGEIFCSACQANWWTTPELLWPKGVIKEHFAIGPYQDRVLQTLLLQWKYHQVASAKRALLSLVQSTMRDYLPAISSVDAVTFVPLHWRKKNERGFDQAEELAVAVAEVLEVPVLSLLTRRRYTSQQAQVEREKRAVADFEDVFSPLSLSLFPKKILLVDDVWTTGTTISAAASALLRGGVTEVSALTIAKG